VYHANRAVRVLFAEVLTKGGAVYIRAEISREKEGREAPDYPEFPALLLVSSGELLCLQPVQGSGAVATRPPGQRISSRAYAFLQKRVIGI
jgi:hypothetical protein